jgi:hypothetical protein
VTATITVATLLTQLIATLGGGFLGVAIGLRPALVVGPVIGLLAFVAVWFSPVRHIRTIEELAVGDTPVG